VHRTLIDAIWQAAIVVLFFPISAILQGCGSTVDLASDWSNSAVVIDGKADEWLSLNPVKDTPIQLGFRNDPENLYLCLQSSDRQFRQQLMGLGMTVWFEPKGGDKIGIHYPLGIGMAPGGSYGGPGGKIQDGEGSESQSNRGRSGQGMGEGAAGNAPEIVKELEILGPGKNDVDRMPIVQAQGIEVRIGQSQEMVVYELKIPLKKTDKHPYALASNPGSIVGVTFETAKFTRPQGSPGETSGGPSGGGTGGYPRGGDTGGMGPPPGGMGPIGGGGDDGGQPGGMPGGGMGGGRRGGRGGESGPGGGRTEPKQFKLETEVTLASGPASSTTK
jgi:hypothetical protein